MSFGLDIRATSERVSLTNKSSHMHRRSNQFFSDHFSFGVHVVWIFVPHPNFVKVSEFE